jgi:hypothetical protein
MTEGIIDALEVVQVDKQKRCNFVAKFVVVYSLLESLFKGNAVMQIG